MVLYSQHSKTLEEILSETLVYFAGKFHITELMCESISLNTLSIDSYLSCQHQESRTRRSVSSKPAWAIKQVPGQFGIGHEKMSYPNHSPKEFVCSY